MCGIAGAFRFDGERVEHELWSHLDSLLAHRGPDDVGLKLFDAGGLLHRRLAIIDLSPAGHGPMPNEDGTLWVTFNGEIYNYRELMPELVERGHVFRSVCDTEVLLHAYEEYGDACVEKFNGMFAFAIFDCRRQQLFLARDRSGVKPLYFALNGNQFAFASEPKALLAVPWVRRKPDDATIFDYLIHGVVDHSERTFFSDVRSLPAAHTGTFDERGLTLKRYWQLPSADPERLTMPASRVQRLGWSENYLSLLTDSIALRMRSDVAVGSCLSGGLDSSTIVSIANRLLFPASGPDLNEHWHQRGERQKTFSACFDDPAIDERSYMRAVTEQTGAAAYATFPNGDSLLEDVADIVWHQDEPFLSTGIVAQWYVMKLARQHGVTVLLDGQGADEVLCGYSGYYGPYFADLMAAGRVTELVREVNLYNRYHGAKWGSGQKALAQALRARHAVLQPRLRSRFNPVRTLPDWLEPALAFDSEGHLRSAPAGYARETRGYLPSVAERLFTATSLPALLRYEDRNSMAFAIEARVPYLDYRLVEFVFKAPNAMRFGDGMNKRVLRDASSGLIPNQIRRRRDKLGYSTPEDRWLRGPAFSQIRQLFRSSSAAAHGYLRDDQILRELDKFSAGAHVPAALVWRWVNLELWLRRMVDSRPAAKSRQGVKLDAAISAHGV